MANEYVCKGCGNRVKVKSRSSTIAIKCSNCGEKKFVKLA